ncbi:MAG: hypothetical protein HDR71_15535 [Lachnospiraceae bacterium]|nr:hypothetical protein [Lachnospiraceae bacterium]
MNRIINQINIKDYPIGTKVRLDCDYPEDGPREVAGHKRMYEYDYLVFTDGYMAYIGRVVR